MKNSKDIGNSDVQEAEKPSEIIDKFWLVARRKDEEYIGSTENSGKWLIFVHYKKVDEIWKIIKKATESGKLGSSSKVSTARPNPNAIHRKTHVICVYTYDYTDREDVIRIREELGKLGFTKELPYKTDKATHEERYSIKGDENISHYYV